MRFCIFLLKNSVTRITTSNVTVIKGQNHVGNWFKERSRCGVGFDENNSL